MEIFQLIQATRDDFKARKKQQQKMKKALKKEQGITAPKKKYIEQESSGITVLVDLSFVDYMSEKEIFSTISQVKSHLTVSFLIVIPATGF
jgi:hypothetical protein